MRDATLKLVAPEPPAPTPPGPAPAAPPAPSLASQFGAPLAAPHSAGALGGGGGGAGPGGARPTATRALVEASEWKLGGLGADLAADATPPGPTPFRGVVLDNEVGARMCVWWGVAWWCECERDTWWGGCRGVVLDK